MTLTNGQDQSAKYRRTLGRQGLERGRERPLLPTAQLEMRNVALSRPVSPDEVRRMLVRQGALSVGPSTLDVSGEYLPRAKGRDYPAAVPTGSRQEPRGLAQGYKNVCERWSLDALAMAKLLHLEEETGLCELILSGQVPPLTGDLKDRMAFVIGISIGLGELFDDDKDAELQWLTSERADLGGISPLEHMLKGSLSNVKEVVDIVENARGLR